MWKLVQVLFLTGAIGIAGYGVMNGAKSATVQGGARKSVAAAQAIIAGQVLDTGYKAAAEKGTVINPFDAAQEDQAPASSSQQTTAKTEIVIDPWQSQYPEDGAAKTAVN